MQKNKRGVSAILDDFYTKDELAARLLRDVERVTKRSLDSWNMVIEPSAGGGSFFNLLSNKNRRGYDVRPTCDGVETADFLEVGNTCFHGKSSDILVVGNPPFGKNGSLALRFLNLCLQHAEWVAFILPRSFEKESVLARVKPLTAHIVHQEVLPLNSFRRAGVSHSIPTVFMVWRILPDAIPRSYCMQITHPDFEFVSGPAETDIRSKKLAMIQRVGQMAGKFSRKEEDMISKRKSKNFYFVRSRFGPSVLERLEQLNIVNSSSKYQTAGMPSISKSDIVLAYIASQREPDKGQK